MKHGSIQIGARKNPDSLRVHGLRITATQSSLGSVSSFSPDGRSSVGEADRQEYFSIPDLAKRWRCLLRLWQPVDRVQHFVGKHRYRICRRRTLFHRSGSSPGGGGPSNLCVLPAGRGQRADRRRHPGSATQRAHVDARWPKLLAALDRAVADADKAIKEPALRKEILALVDEDQKARFAVVMAAGARLLPGQYGVCREGTVPDTLVPGRIVLELQILACRIPHNVPHASLIPCSRCVWLGEAAARPVSARGSRDCSVSLSAGFDGRPAS